MIASVHTCNRWAGRVVLATLLGCGGWLRADEAAELFGRGEARYQAGDWQGAAAAYAAVLTNFPASRQAPQALYSRGWALFQAGDCAGALADFRLFLERYPTHALTGECQLKTGDTLRKLGRLDEAWQVYASARAAGGRLAPEALAGQAWVSFARRDFAAAQEAFYAVSQTYAPDARAAQHLYNAGQAAWEAQQYVVAGKRFAAVVADYPRSPLAVEAAFRQGRAAEAAGDVAAAAASYTAAVHLSRDDNELAQRAAVELIRLEHVAKRYEVALAKATAFLERQAASAAAPRARLYRAEALQELNRWPEALQAYQQVGASDPAVAAGATNGAAWVLRRLGRYPEAAQAFAAVAAGSSTYAGDALFWSARSHEDAGAFEAARAAYGACLRLAAAAPHADEAAYRQAYCLWQSRKLEDAQRLYHAVIQERGASPFAAHARYDLAWVLLELGQKSEARQRFEAFARQYPRHPLAPDASFRIGELAYEAGAFAVAATNYQAAAAAQLAFCDKALYKLGWAREKLAQPAVAAQTFLLLAQRYPQSAFAQEALYRAGRLWQTVGKWEEARAAWAQVQEGGSAEQAACGVAECWRALGKPTEAAAAYGQVLAKWPQGACRVAALLGRAEANRATGAWDAALVDYREVATGGGETRAAAQAMLGEGHGWFALQKWEEAASCFAKVDLLFEFAEFKPEALDMLARSWEQAGDARKAAIYREERRQRFPQGP